MLFERTRRAITKALTSTKTTCRGAARALRRRETLRSDAKWQHANQVATRAREARLAAEEKRRQQEVATV